MDNLLKQFVFSYCIFDFIFFRAHNKISNIFVFFFYPASCSVSRLPAGKKEQIEIKMHRLATEPDNVLYFPMELFQCTAICDFDKTVRLLECENKTKKKTTDLFLFFQPGEKEQIIFPAGNCLGEQE